MPPIGLISNDLWFMMVLLRALVPLLLFSLLLASPAVGQSKLEIIPLKNRLVEDVIPTIRSVLGKRGTVTGMQGQLIIRAHPKALQEVKDILSQIDAALKNLRITVKQGTRLRLNEEERSVTAKIPVGENGRVVIGGAGSDKIIVENEKSDGNVQVRLLDKKRQADKMDTQTVMTLEGRPASIYITQSIPIREVSNIRSGNQITAFESIRFEDVRTGLMVLPRLKGNQVILEVSPQKSRLNGQSIETFGIDTVVRGQIGKWMELGGVTQKRKGAETGIGDRTVTRNDESRKVFLKVDYP
jgi:type II secretory pathway component GspD/PulD (secretin)